MLRRLRLLLPVLLCLPACVLPDPAGLTLGGFGNAFMVRHPGKVDACLLRYAPTKDGHVRYEEEDYVTVPADLVPALTAAVIGEATTDSGSPRTLCAPHYVARIRFHRGPHTLALDETVSFDFCFHCQIMGINQNGTEIAERRFHSGVFFSALRQLFPNAPVFAKIKERSEPTRPRHP